MSDNPDSVNNDVDMVNVETSTPSTTTASEKEEEEIDTTVSKDESGETTDTCSEKNESKDIDDDDFLYCSECKTSDCFMWRRLNNSKNRDLVCSLCHLKHIKNENNAQQQSNIPHSSTNKTPHTTSTSSNKTKDTVRISKRKNKVNKKFTNGFYGERIIKNGHSKSRRNLYKRKPTKSADGIPSIVASQCIYHNGILYQTGDVVCTCDVEGGTYFAQLRGFLQDDFCEKAAVVTWLIPTQRNLKHFDPLLFIPGLDEEMPRPLSSFDFVCRASAGLFKSPNVHLPFQRSQTNLENLIYAASTLTDKENNSEIPLGSKESKTS